MTQETLLLTTSDNHIIAINLQYANAAEKLRKVKQYEQLCENTSYSDFQAKYNNFATSGVCSGVLEREFFPQVDCENTDFLEKEINNFDFVKKTQNYKNNVKDNNYPSSIASKPDTVHFDNSIDDTEIPPLIKNLGFTIEPQDNVYDVKFDSAKQKYEAENYDIRRASVNVKKRKIIWVRNHYTFSPSEYVRLNGFIKDFEKQLSNNPTLSVNQYSATIANDKDRNLFLFYAFERKKEKQRLLMLKHELTHIKNKILLTGIGLKKNSKRLSMEDYYRLQVEDERSAYLSQVVNAANIYLKNGNPKDFGMFDYEAVELVKTLKQLPENARFSYVQNPKNLLDVSFKSFEKNHKKHYDDGQFVTNMKLEADRIPLSAEKDDNRADFFKRRSLLYHFQLYNPQTKSYDAKNFTPFIDKTQEVEVNSENIAKIITPCKQILSRRLAEYNRDKTQGKINPDLVEEAKALMRDNLKKSKLVNSVNGMEISDLVDDKTKSTPTPPVPPRNPATWSRDIEAYWSKFDGYKEIANTQDEYSFSINKNKIRYTAKNKVQMAGDAEYDMYVKLLKEPSNKNMPVIFKDTLSKEQALKLYVACVNNNRQMKGFVPKDFSMLKNLHDVPAADLQKCQQYIRLKRGQNPLPQKQTWTQGGR